MHLRLHAQVLDPWSPPIGPWTVPVLIITQAGATLKPRWEALASILKHLGHQIGHFSESRIPFWTDNFASSSCTSGFTFDVFSSLRN